MQFNVKGVSEVFRSQNFFMAIYTKLLENEIQEIMGRYEFSVTSYEPIAQGSGNSNYLLNTNHGKFVLTVFEIEPIWAVYSSKVLLLLEKHEFPAPRLQKMAKGEMLTKYQGKPVLVKPYITGYVEADIDDEKAKQVGTAIAKLHEIPAPDYLPENKTWVEQRYRYIIEKLPSQLPVGLVHGDIFYDNVLFEDDNFKAILDFSEVSRIYKIYDLGMAVVGICTEETNIVIEKVRALIEGYQEIRFLEEIEKDSLQLCIEWAAILTSTWRFWKYNIDVPDADKSEKYLQMVYIAKNVSAIPKEEFKMAVFS
jgi:homoserine kinase type II